MIECAATYEMIGTHGTYKDINTLIQGGTEISAKLQNKIGKVRAPISLSAKSALQKVRDKMNIRKKLEKEWRDKERQEAVDTLMDDLCMLCNNFSINKTQIHYHISEGVDIRTIVTSQVGNQIMIIRSGDTELNEMVKEVVEYYVRGEVKQWTNEVEVAFRIDYSDMFLAFEEIVDNFG